MLYELAILVGLFLLALSGLVLGAAMERARGFISSEYDGFIVGCKVLIIVFFIALVFLIFPLPQSC